MRRCIFTEKYEEIYARMAEKYEQESGAEIDGAGDIAIKLRLLAGEIYNLQVNFDWLKRQMFPSTAEGGFLDRFAEMRGLARKQAQKAKGVLRFSIKEAKSDTVTIPAGTVVSTNGESPVRIYTTEDAEMITGTLSVLVNAEAEQPGFKGNIKVNTAVVPVNVPSEIDSVTNPSLFKGGSDEEVDEALRERIRESYSHTANGLNAQYYIDLATSVEGVAKAGVVARLNGLGSLTVYVAGSGGRVTDEALAEASALLKAHRELNVDIKVQRASAQAYDLDVTVTARKGIESAEVIQRCTDAFISYLSTVPIGGKLYLSGLGKYLLDTGCIESYEFSDAMESETVPYSAYFSPGEIYVEVV